MTTQTLKASPMRNTLRNAVLGSLLVGGALIGCTQDLNLKNPNAPDTSNFWKTDADALNGINRRKRVVNLFKLREFFFGQCPPGV